MPHERYICEILSKQVSKQVMSRSINITVQFSTKIPSFSQGTPLTTPTEFSFNLKER